LDLTNFGTHYKGVSKERMSDSYNSFCKNSHLLMTWFSIIDSSSLFLLKELKPIL